MYPMRSLIGALNQSRNSYFMLLFIVVPSGIVCGADVELFSPQPASIVNATIAIAKPKPKILFIKISKKDDVNCGAKICVNPLFKYSKKLAQQCSAERISESILISLLLTWSATQRHRQRA